MLNKEKAIKFILNFLLNFFYSYFNYLDKTYTLYLYYILKELIKFNIFLNIFEKKLLFLLLKIQLFLMKI